MKAILMSDRAYWCMLMMNKKKKVEVRKGTALYKAIQKLIDEYGYADIYVYCTKGKPYLGKKEIGRNFYNEPIYTYDLDYGETFKGNGNKKFYSSVGVYSINGKVVFKFRCYKVEEIYVGEENNDYFYKTKRLTNKNLQNKSCLSNRELLDYLNLEQGTAIHINDLEIFDKPKELSEFYKLGAWKVYEEQFDSSYMRRAEQEIMKSLNQTLTKAPQSWCYVETGE